MSIKLILTCDYETWGDGSGCVENCVIAPADEMIAIANRYDVPLTFFFDVCEYWAFEEVEQNKLFTNGYKPASLMRTQLQSAVKQGHDVQLHFHPQWLNYKFLANQKWELDYRYWRIPEVENFHDGKWNIQSLFERGVKTLETLFDFQSTYKVLAFRAGAWSIQPEKLVIDAMLNSGIRYDSTVAAGRKFEDGRTKFNFEDSPFLSHWKTGDELTKTGSGPLIEVPIFSHRLVSFKLFEFLLRKLLNRRPLKPVKCERSEPTKSAEWRLFDKLRPQYKMLNFSDGVSFEEMVWLTNKARVRFEEKNPAVPVVAISHTKTFGNGGEFEKFLIWCRKQNDISFGTYHDVNAV